MLISNELTVNKMNNPYLPLVARVIENREETPDIFTLRLQLKDAHLAETYSFEPGQFNMLYMPGVGEVPISIVSDPQDKHCIDHTIRAVGRVTRVLQKLQAGDELGIRGPFGSSWPMAQIKQQDVLIITGGLGCAPVVSVINYIVKRRSDFGRLVIMQGVKHSNDLIWKDQYQQWAALDNTQVALAANQTTPAWSWSSGYVTDLFDEVCFNPDKSIAMLCGPEIMMSATIRELLQRGLTEQQVWLTMERNMQCAVGHCGHCQHGSKFVCKDGPVFNYPAVKDWFFKEGF